MTKQIPELVLAIDFSLDKLDVSLRGEGKKWLWAHRAYENNWHDLQVLKRDLLAVLNQIAPVKLTIAGESTGPYWYHAFYHLSHDDDLQPFSPELALLNPAHVKGYRKVIPERDKADPEDARLIDRYYRTVGVKHPYQFYDRYSRLRTYSRAYSRVTHSLASEKAYLLSVLYLSASEYARKKKKETPFSDLFGATSMYIIDEFADIHTIADIPLAELTELLKQRSGNSFRKPEENARKLHNVARHSYPLPKPMVDALHQVINHTLAHIRMLSDNQLAYRRLIVQELDTLPEARQAIDFKGLGPILVAGCLSEIQDTSRFITGYKFDHNLQEYRPRTYRDGQAAVAKLAGLWWPKHDSGHVQGIQPHLARERNPHLRYWLVQAAHTLRMSQPDYSQFYWKKYHESTSNHHKRAITMTARKAVRLLFALLHKGRIAALKEGLLT
jgi:transposase